ncbi:MAG TPA: hypothetical protein PKZ32_11210, partial [Candidatus Melainabacteria bacterium]|nr:hypothetical protein [Candidatus Melainabacteria bacterium]
MAINQADSTSVERPGARVAPLERSQSLADQTDLSIPENFDRKPVQMASLEDRGARRDVGNPTFAITDGDRVVAGADQKPLSENSLNAGKVRNGEGYFQSAERLMGSEFTHKEKRQFTDALKKSWVTDHPDSKSLRTGDQL